MTQDGKKISAPYLNIKCPLCNSLDMERVKGTAGDWVREYSCKKCNSLIEFNEGDKMGGQFDVITILKDNFHNHDRQ